MLTLYFSGTGNTRHVAIRFSARMPAECHSIEEECDFDALIQAQETVCFCYPIYGSCVPRILREFVLSHRSALAGKNLVLFCTQLLFSGDGARVFTDLLKDIPHRVMYAEHIRMPNNLCNVFVLPVRNGDQCRRTITKADHAVDRAVAHIRAGRIVKRGFHPFSRALGFFLQRAFFPQIEASAGHSVRVNRDCTSCGLCVRQCPMDNLHLEPAAEGPGILRQDGNCTLCYRCVNLCPQKAITVMLHARVRHQYHGPCES